MIAAQHKRIIAARLCQPNIFAKRGIFETRKFLTFPFAEKSYSASFKSSGKALMILPIPLFTARNIIKTGAQINIAAEI